MLTPIVIGVSMPPANRPRFWMPDQALDLNLINRRHRIPIRGRRLQGRTPRVLLTRTLEGVKDSCPKG